MERGNSSQLFVHLLGYILKVKGTQVEQQQRKTFLEFVAILNLPPLHCWCSHCHFQTASGLWEVKVVWPCMPTLSSQPAKPAAHMVLELLQWQPPELLCCYYVCQLPLGLTSGRTAKVSGNHCHLYHGSSRSLVPGGTAELQSTELRLYHSPEGNSGQWLLELLPYPA